MRTGTPAALLGVLLLTTAASAEELKSGPPVGEKLPGPFNALVVNGPQAGQKRCLVCKHRDHPVAMVFAREVSPPLVRLIKKLDEATVANAAASMGSFVVFCNDDATLEEKLGALATKEGLKQTVLSIDAPAGPSGYKVAADAEVTVVLYAKHRVEVNHAFRKEALTDKDVDRILAELSKILPAK